MRGLKEVPHWCFISEGEISWEKIKREKKGHEKEEEEIRSVTQTR